MSPWVHWRVLNKNTMWLKELSNSAQDAEIVFGSHLRQDFNIVAVISFHLDSLSHADKGSP